MTEMLVVEVRLEGVDCAECATGVKRSLERLPGVAGVQLFTASQKAVLRVDGEAPSADALQRAVEREGCRIAPPSLETLPELTDESRGRSFGRSILVLLGFVVLGIVLVAVVGEFLGLFEILVRNVPWPVGWAAVLLGGYPVFRQTLRAALRRRITSGTLMTLGAVAALVTGRWPVALVVMAFMRVSDYVESFTGEQSRRALRELLALAPQSALVERDGLEIEVPLPAVEPGDIVIIRPGARIPVDGVVLGGSASVDQATITGESMPVDVSAGDRVLAATIATGGTLRVRTERIGEDTTFGRILRLVEVAESHASRYQRLADRVATLYLPVVIAVAALTFALTRSVSATVAVLVVACPCSFALATPVAVLASVGAAAKRGLVIKGGKYLELLGRADVVLIDKTGTLTLGCPVVTDVLPLDGWDEKDVLRVAASAERYSEHPLGEAIRAKAAKLGLRVGRPEEFLPLPGAGVQAKVDGLTVMVGSDRFESGGASEEARRLREHGKTVLHVMCDGQEAGVFGVSDELRPDARRAIEGLRGRGVDRIEVLTGDNEPAAALVASQLGIGFRANLLPEDKIERVRALQARGLKVVMIGDGVNDAPALAQADVGIAMGVAGSDVAIEAADIALMREDWSAIPELFDLARRTTRVIKGSLLFTIGYNVVGVSLAALGILPPVIAAASQSLPDFGIVGNSARLLRSR